MTPKRIETAKEKADFSEKKTIAKSTIVLGKPKRTPSVNSLITPVSFFSTQSQIMLNKLTSGNAAMTPPYVGKRLAISVTTPIMIAERSILTISCIFRSLT